MLDNRKIIALCISGIHEITSFEFVVALNEKISEMGYTLFVYSTYSELDENNTSVYGQSSVFELMDFSIIDAVIVFNEKIKNKNVIDSIISRAKAHGTPVAVIGEKYPDCTNIEFDNDCGFEMLARHIVEAHSISTIHFLAGDKGNVYSEQRIEVLKRVLKNSHIDFDDSMISYCGFWFEPAERAVNKLIDDNNIPDAVICANDIMAIAAAGVFAKRGIKVPDDVIVTGYDGIDDIKFTTPRITSVKCSHSILAERLAEVLPDIIDGKLTNRSVYVTPELILSESCGCTPCSVISAAEYMNMLNK
ncbi:MAG: substrate-binding domain-containing protein, partial [Oscillospiraceae bacterium]|nr:substrate-binding domain-containing protein [Oscillospiraceae bacterium]